MAVLNVVLFAALIGTALILGWAIRADRPTRTGLDVLQPTTPAAGPHASSSSPKENHPS